MTPISVGCMARSDTIKIRICPKTVCICICQVAADNGLDGILTMIATPSLFFNECEVHFQFNWKSLAELPGDVIVQVAKQDSHVFCSVLSGDVLYIALILWQSCFFLAFYVFTVCQHFRWLGEMFPS